MNKVHLVLEKEKGANLERLNKRHEGERETDTQKEVEIKVWGCRMA